MAERTVRAVLNDLIETSRDGARGFREAADLVQDVALKRLLLEFADTRQEFAAQLEPHAQRLGGAATSDGTAAASVHRRWMELKSALTGHDEYAVMTEVLRGDGVTLRLFADAAAGVLPATVRDLIEQQESLIRAQHAHIAEAAARRRAETML
jgi:uncharacterized protein (TIGR02284 family)